MAEIAEAGARQSEGIEQIGQAISDMDGMTQQNSALVEESAAAAESLNGHATQLAAAVSTFKLDRKGKAPVSGGQASHHGPGHAADATFALTTR
jgi:methyl-accepting chemotaxis protein